MRVLSLVALGLVCFYSVAGEEHLFKSETHGESGFLFNRIKRDLEGLNSDHDMKGIFLAGSSLNSGNENKDPRQNPRDNPNSGSSDIRNNQKGERTSQTNKK